MEKRIFHHSRHFFFPVMSTSDGNFKKQHDTEEDSADIFSKGPDGKSFRLFGGHIISAVLFGSHIVVPQRLWATHEPASMAVSPPKWAAGWDWCVLVSPWNRERGCSWWGSRGRLVGRRTRLSWNHSLRLPALPRACQATSHPGAFAPVSSARTAASWDPTACSLHTSGATKRRSSTSSRKVHCVWFTALHITWQYVTSLRHYLSTVSVHP